MTNDKDIHYLLCLISCTKMHIGCFTYEKMKSAIYGDESLNSNLANGNI